MPDTVYAQISAGPSGPFQTIAVPCKDAPLWWHAKGLSFTRSGYGGRIPTARMVQLPGSPRWRRVYVAIWSNSGTAYVEDRAASKLPNGRYPWIIIRDY